ncbi:vanadium-dependent haloperoxidase [Streptomyces benahoarensis]|uniref:Vanadium-dependent haloperoxidase n=1 Tax=Streptomyces benahoarensis TaxID=2595054 RepID=A0A553ZQE3_9ACTN|nr:vanadium-dependent haloperoxidase [Streptomyces benahoarensis]TSB31776.1 vanadium-dependent haloperoxidase [Streptomyces benahoarensis]TSB43694.1 vanadium-dependent haloperoxidase [Streptomyces benahoarensis]
MNSPKTRVALVASTALLVATGAASSVTAAPAPGNGRTSVALAWYDTTADTIAKAGPSLPPVTNNRTWAVSWIAAARALQHVPSGVDRRDYQDAALAAAVHRALVELVPSTPPAFAPAIRNGNRFARPFLLKSASQFRLPAPPAPTSKRYQTDLKEVRDFGELNSTVRTARQTGTATFWFESSPTLWTKPIRVALTATSHQPLLKQAELVALANATLVDTQIATSDSKYTYQLWRPVTAIRTGVGEIPADPSWTPLRTTPAHPDHPSGHNTYAGAAETVLTALVGPRTAPFTLTSATAPGVVRTYTGWHQLTRENIDARVWLGIHTRLADEAGVELGTDVARYGLDHAQSLFQER